MSKQATKTTKKVKYNWLNIGLLVAVLAGIYYAVRSLFGSTDKSNTNTTAGRTPTSVTYVPTTVVATGGGSSTANTNNTTNTGTPVTITYLPTDVNWTKSGGVQAQNSTNGGLVFLGGFGLPVETATLAVSVTTGGTYTLKMEYFNVATASQNPKMEFILNGATPIVQNVPGNGVQAANIQVLTFTVTLLAGANTIKFQRPVHNAPDQSGSVGITKVTLSN